MAAAFDSMANDIESQRASRGTAAQGALEDWRGEAVAVFIQRVSTGDADAGQLVTALRDAAEDVRAMERAAREEQARREAGRAYIRALEENEQREGLWNQFTDWWSGEDFEPPPMPPPPTPEPNLAPPVGPASDRV